MNSEDSATVPEPGVFGFVHSVETAGAVDGPGLRYVVFLQGCHLRCQYCHNPDTWTLDGGERISADRLAADIGKYRDFLVRYGGGVTLSGGEPLIQYDFVLETVRRCKAQGIHVALDTNGFLGDRVDDELLTLVDLWILDLKSFDSEVHKRATGVNNPTILRFAERLANHGKSLWIRFVVVPGLTDGADNVAGLANFVGWLPKVDRVELLPFHNLGAYKWRALGLDYQLDDTPAPSDANMTRVRQAFADCGVEAC